MMLQNISPRPALVGFALPKRINPENYLQNCKQKFYTPNIVQRLGNQINQLVTQSVRVARTRTLVVTARVRKKPFTVKKIIKTSDAYFKLTDVEFFSEQNENGNPITENLPGKLQLNLNPQQTSKCNCPTIKETLVLKKMELDIESLLLIWVEKLLSGEYYHLPKFVRGLACINFSPLSKKKSEEISQEMVFLRKQYSLLYLGYALGTLFTVQPTKVIKEPYDVQIAIRCRNISNTKKNDFSYHLVYDRPLQFVFDNQTHTVDIRMIFHIFRYEFKENGKIFRKTCINLDSFYPVGSLNKITFKKWKKSFFKTENLEEQQSKFRFAKELFQNESIFDKLQEIGWTEGEIKERLGVSSLIFDEVFTGPVT